ncbi:hypothetical protein NA56DRAFT_712589 [Hyaloscypha hepaticicola]|uniref:Uncharacterized protein n=1 Tax=Hyaloscypha hepaticicola TaxID=2082293 RepID=A0A2J6PGA2_9HELO|nr:hypothetical protein NA56DRAFT_712589 [Hyaloscypha hepaticicola]
MNNDCKEEEDGQMALNKKKYDLLLKAFVNCDSQFVGNGAQLQRGLPLFLQTPHEIKYWGLCPEVTSGGISRNWIAEGQLSHPKVTLAERKFLSQAQDILLSDVSRRDSPPEQFIFQAPFHFTISRMVASTNSASPEQCLQLPPSLELGASFIDESASVIIAGSNPLESLETSLPVIITPHTDELPPTETEDFPSDLLEDHSETRLRNDILRLETQFVKDVSWGYRFEIGRPADEGPSDATVQTSHSEEMSVAGAAGKDNTISPQTAAQNRRWISNWTIPIEVEGRFYLPFAGLWLRVATA